MNNSVPKIRIRKLEALKTLIELQQVQFVTGSLQLTLVSALEGQQRVAKWILVVMLAAAWHLYTLIGEQRHDWIIWPCLALVPIACYLKRYLAIKKARVSYEKLFIATSERQVDIMERINYLVDMSRNEIEPPPEPAE